MRFALSFAVGLLVTVMAGCSGNSHKSLVIDKQQSLVMDSSVMTAGITAERPAIGDEQGRKRAFAEIHNNQSHPVALHYRFYWYDQQGLDILPFPDSQTLLIPAGGAVTVDAVTGNLEAQRVRLYLYL